jgi:hypothetical protein
MSANRTAVLVAAVLLSVSASAQAQKFIHGSVRGTDHRDVVPPTFAVTVTAVDVSTDRPLARETFIGALFGMSVEHNRTVKLIFQSDGYAPYTVPRIDTGTERRVYKVPPVPVVLSRIYGRSLAGKQVGEELRRSRAVAKITGAVDVFLYNLEIYKQVYRDKPDVLTEIERFKTETKASEEFRELLTPERESQMNSFGEIIRFRSRSISTLNPGTALDLIKDDTIFPGIRAQAAQAFTALEGRSPEMTARALEYFREQAASSDSSLLAPSYAALVSIGAEADVNMVLEKINGTDFEQSVAAMAAVAEARLARGIPALSELLKPEADPTLKLVAASSLKRLNIRGLDGAATAALAAVLGGDDDAAARAAAAEGLARAPLTSYAAVTLRQASVNDNSFDVRVAAAGARVVNNTAVTFKPRARF